jgi:hypothetical protein
MLEDKIIEIFVKIDDFHQEFEEHIKKTALEEGSIKRKRSSKLSDAEIMTILVGFHLSQIKNFKAYYIFYITTHLGHLFPDLVSYNRFVELQPKVALALMFYLKYRGLGKSTGISYIDSTPLKVCHIKREKQNKVFKNFAKKGHSTLGWFYGFKLHLVINDKGEILGFHLTTANVDDRDIKVMQSITRDIFGKLFGDKGYISKALSDLLFQDGIQLITKVRKNMKGQNLSQTDKILLRKRAIIESVNDELKNIASIEHTRHRSINGFLINIVTALVAYSFFTKKPSLNIEFENTNQLSLTAA